MAIDVANDYQNALVYGNIPAVLESGTYTHFWMGCWFKMDNYASNANDSYILSFTRSDAGSFNGSIVLFWDLAGGAVESARIYVEDDDGNSGVSADCGDNFHANNNWNHVMAHVYLSGGNVFVEIYADGNPTAKETSNGTYTVSGGGGFDLIESLFRFGSHQQNLVTDADTDPFEGLLEGVFVAVGNDSSDLTDAEHTALQTQHPSIALANSNATLVFSPDLLRNTVFTCPFQGGAATVDQTPVRRLGPPAMKYGYDPSFCVIGDTQFLTAAEYLTLANRIVDHATSLNVKAVLHVGDWAHDLTPGGATRLAELDNVRAAIDIIIDALPLTFTLGNHDVVDGVGKNRNDDDFVSKIPRSLFTGASWHEDALGTGVDDHYVHSFFIDLGNSTNDLIICLPMAPVSDHWIWAKAQAAANPFAQVWIITHAWLNSTGNLYTDQDTGVDGENEFRPKAYFSNFSDAPVDPGGTSAGSFEDGDWWIYAHTIPNLRGIFSGHDIVPSGSSEKAQQLMAFNLGGRFLHSYTNAQDITGGDEGFCQFIEHNGNGSINGWGYQLVNDAVTSGGQDIFNATVSTRSSNDNPMVYLGQGNTADVVNITNIDLTGDFSFCFKAKFADVTTHPSSGSICIASTDVDDFICFTFTGTNFICRFKCAGNSQVDFQVATSGLVSVNTWHTFILTRDNTTGQLRLYVDNTLGPDSGADGNGIGTFDFDQLFRRGASSDPWQDSIYDIQVYDGILSFDQRDEVVANKLATPTAALPAVLRAWYRCQDSSSSTTTLDWSPNANDGTNVFVNDAAWHVNDTTALKDYSNLSNPSDLVTIDAWYNASNPNNLEIDIGINKWINSILPGTADLEQATSGSRPSTGNPIGPNDLNALRFVEGTPDDQLEVVTGAIDRIQTLEVWLVFRLDDPSTGANQVLFDSEANPKRQRFWSGSTGIPNMGSDSTITGGSIPDDSLPHIARCLFKATPNGELFLDSVSIVSGNIGTDSLRTLSVGGNNSAGSGITGEIGEIILSNRELPSREVTFLENYLARWTTASAGASSTNISIGISI